MLSSTIRDFTRAHPSLSTTPRIRATSTNPRNRGLGQSIAIWLGLVGFMVMAKLLSMTVMPITARSAAQQALFDWTSIAMYAVLGVVGVLCAQQTGFPAAWDSRITVRQRLGYPALIGLVIGTAAVVLDRLSGASDAIARLIGQPSLHIDFPGSLLAYSAGAIEMELQYRLFTLPFLLWLVSGVLLRGRGERVALIVLGTIAALFEPILQGVGIAIMGAGAITPIMLGAYMLTALPANAAEVVTFRKYGLLAPIALRLGQYAVWHVLYGNFLSTPAI